jgi:DNA repair protein RadC
MLGEQALSDAELVAVVLGTGSVDQPVSIVAASVLRRVGGLHGLRQGGMAALEAVPGVGATKACRLLAALELGTRLASRPLSPARPIRSSADVDAALRARLRDSSREHFYAIALDAKNRPLAELLVAVGGLTACAVSPADVFRSVLRQPAAAVIFAHNHPSGEPGPSDEDLALTERLCRAGKLLGIGVLDHIILGHEGYFSFLDAGLIK